MSGNQERLGEPYRWRLDVKDGAKYFQEDGLHPRASAQEIMMNNIMPELLESLKDLEKSKSKANKGAVKRKKW
jgi:lysophospholipase L1-like esterase